MTTRPERHQPSPLIVDDPEFLTAQPVIPTTLVCPEYSIYTPVTSQLLVDSIESIVSSSLPLTTSDTFLPEQRLSTLFTSFNQRFQKYTIAIIHFGITVVSGIFAIIYSILRYFFWRRTSYFLLGKFARFSPTTIYLAIQHFITRITLCRNVFHRWHIATFIW